MSFIKDDRTGHRIGSIAGLTIIGVAVGVLYPSSAWSCATNVPADGPAEQVFDIEIERGKVAEDMRTIRVMENDTVYLHWIADAPLVLHLHGYDIEEEIKPGAVTAFTFEAHTTGRFPVDVHNEGGAAHRQAAIVYLEVYPR